ncbi:unnamed protein product, partial [Phaeothamnion confervicola]
MRVSLGSTEGVNALLHYLQSQLAGGEWPIGMKLPAERELGARFTLSRGDVRKVIASFIARGLLRRTPGSGTYVASAAPQASRPMLAPIEVGNVSPAELMEARLLFEPLLPRLIVRHATPQDFARFEQCLAGAERAA